MMYSDTKTFDTLQSAIMTELTQIDQIAERVDRLLLRFEELTRTNALLVTQLSTLTQERDSLKSRLAAARARVDALLERLPVEAASTGIQPTFKPSAARLPS